VIGSFKLRFTFVLLCGAALAGVYVARTGTTTAARTPRAVNVAYSELSLVTEPGPGDQPFLEAVQSARSSVDLVMYELSDPTFEQALLNAARRGVQVHVLLNDGYYGSGSSANQAAYRYLTARGVRVRWSPSRFALTHQKTLVTDDSIAYIMTLNLVDEDYPTSRDFAVVDRNAQDLAAIERTFTADWNNQAVTPSDGADLVWSPGALGPQLSLINSARHSLDIYNEEMDDSAVTSALEAAARRGVDVKVVMTASSEWDSAFKGLADAGVHVRTYKQDASLYIHAKMILVDGRRAFLGSQNFSAGSLDDNRELGITVEAGDIIDSLEGTFGGDYSHATPLPASGHSTPTSNPTPHQTCTVSASWDSSYRDWNVYVQGPADVDATATADGHSHSYYTNSSGYADIYLYAPESAAGDTVTVTAGSARCSGTL
jgi:phosphatidylserine/phosphatidylglycerophosphate/cardiolipin synthase-like enzyme